MTTEDDFRRISYGDSSDQVVDLYPASRDMQQKTIILVHGGYWRTDFTKALMEPLVHFFRDFGVNVANIEYRRGPEQGWPVPLEDVRQAVAAVKEVVDGPIYGIGHSVGGQLVLLAEGQFDYVVALAPVTDATRVFEEGLGEDAAQEYFRVAPHDAVEVYRDASAIHQRALGKGTLLVHGNNDVRVPLEHSRVYAAKQWEADAPVDTFFMADLSHIDCIEPGHAVWSPIVQWMGLKKS